MAPLLSRKADTVYLIFFTIHLIVMFNVDLYPLWPTSLRPSYMDTLRTWYITTYRDQFFVSPPAWFNTYIYLELLYHVPLSLWALGALWRDDPKVPIHLLVYAVQTAVTTLTCIADYLSWPSYSDADKFELGKLYVPYLFVSVLMGVDMVARLSRTVVRARAIETGKKEL